MNKLENILKNLPNIDADVNYANENNIKFEFNDEKPAISIENMVDKKSMSAAFKIAMIGHNKVID